MDLSNKKVMILAANQFEDIELYYPLLRLKEDNIKVDIVGEKADQKYSGKHGMPIKSDCSFSNINTEDYDGILIPGGWAPDRLRRYTEVKKIIKKINSSKKLIGTICHAGWVLASADIVNGRRVTSVSAIKDDLEHAGAIWEDKEVVIDKNLITSRTPKDLPTYMKTIIDKLSE